MIKINEYVDMICDDFEDYLLENPSLCNLKSVNFNAGQLPNYNDIHTQQLYLLRYAYAYAFEYKAMYYTLFENYNYSKGISVTSVGCGSMIDYWSLARMIKEKGWKACDIFYRGIDQVDWNYKFKKRAKDDAQFIRRNAITELENADAINVDACFFPKSISEFSQDDMERICNCFRTKNIMRDLFHVLISIRSDEWSMERDMHKTQQIINAITSNGFEINIESTEYWYIKHDGTKEGKKIHAHDSEFKHPFRAVNITKSLNEQCIHYKDYDFNCDDTCKESLSRWPILNVDMIKYQILTFSRRH